MSAQNESHACNCGKVKVTLLKRKNATQELTKPGESISIVIDDIADLLYVVETDKSGYVRYTTYKVQPLDMCSPNLSTLWANI